MENFELKNTKIAVVGLGYVGLPLAIEFAKKYNVTGFDIKEDRISELLNGRDYTNEANIDELNAVLNKMDESGLRFTSSADEMGGCNVFIITVPTPVDHFKSPDLKSLLYASEIIGGGAQKE